MVEQLTLNQLVTGSSPVGVTKSFLAPVKNPANPSTPPPEQNLTDPEDKQT